MNRRCLVTLPLLALSLSLPLLPGCGREKGNATPQAAMELAELRAEQELGFSVAADVGMQAEITALLSRFDKTADATLASTPHRITLLHLACVYKKAELARCLLLDGADPNARQLMEMPDDEEAPEGEGKAPSLAPGDTPLTWATTPHREGATAEELLPLINLLVENGADVNQPGPYGVPPLHIATMMQSSAGEAVFLRLLELGANPAQEASRMLASVVAANGWPQALARLLDAGAPMVHEKETPLHAAADHAETEGTLECVRLLLERGIEVDALNDEGATPLYIAAHALSTPEGNAPELVESTCAMLALLLQHGANPLRCSDADPEFPGSCAADFIAMSPAAQKYLADKGFSVPRRPINFEAEDGVLLAEICRASLFGTPAEDISPHVARLAALLVTPSLHQQQSPLYPDAFGHTLRLLARVDAPRASELVARLPLWNDDEAWVSADSRTSSLMQALQDTPALVLPRQTLLELARRMDGLSLPDTAASLIELWERDEEAGADIEALCGDASLPLRAGAMTARLLRAGLPAPRNGAVAEWMEEHGLEEANAPAPLRRALLLTSLDAFWYGSMPPDEVRLLLQAMRDIGAPRAAEFYAQIAAHLNAPEKLDQLTGPGSTAATARYELECATAMLLWSQRGILQNLITPGNSGQMPQSN